MKKVFVEKKDMQGLFVRGYGKFHFARFVLLKINNAEEAKEYLKKISDQLNTAAVSPVDSAINIALTNKGLKALKLKEEIYSTFSREFLEGMDDPYRATILGDHDLNDPNNWKWGGPNNDEVHLMLMFYANTHNILDKIFNDHQKDFTNKGISIVKIQETQMLPSGKEHFGFRDGISMPDIDGFGDDPIDNTDRPVQIKELNPMKAGEFVLGYKNEYNSYSERPFSPTIEDTENILPIFDNDANFKDLGKNGTYMVYREISQDVPLFWKYLYENSKEPTEDRKDAAIKLGAKMVGRWPSGASLLNYPDKDVNENLLSGYEKNIIADNNFGYRDKDPDGMLCPFGSHIRRTNPRDKFSVDHNKHDSIEMIRKHQILRRGRAFGKPICNSMNPEDIMKSEDDGEKRGLHFICLVGHIARQFEFVQNAWVQSANFLGMYRDGDPLIGSRINSGENINNEFTCPAFPVRRKYKNLPQFTQLTGGSYFFLPGIKALKFIANCR